MSDLKDKIKQLISINGAMSVAQYMDMALSDPQFGYYKTANPFGYQGDFTTSPEISQMFGELIGIWAVATWQNMQQPQSFVLCEMGPGRGTLMHDVLRTIKQLKPSMLKCAKIFMVETSQRLAAEQQQRLHSYLGQIEWIESFDTIPQSPLILFANELFDALPIFQYIKKDGYWRERVITLNSDNDLSFAIGADQLAASTLPQNINNLPENTILELSPIRNQLMTNISTRLNAQTGSALLIDYGAADFAFGDTLQTMHKHQFSDVFSNPGQHDITSHVDFAALQKIAKQYGCCAKIQTQGEFLVKMGLVERAGLLGANKDTVTQTKITAAVERLAAPDQMGKLFKVLCVNDQQTDFLPIFETSI